MESDAFSFGLSRSYQSRHKSHFGNMSSEEYQIGGDEIEESSAPSSKRTRTSVAWDYFEKFVDDKGLPKAKCKLCGKVYMARDNSGTSNIRRHVKECCVGLEVSSYPPLDQEKFREKISAIIIKHDYPFSFVEHEAVKDMFCFLHPHAKTVSRNTARSDIQKLYRKEKENLKCHLRSIPGNICLTSDLWSSITTNQYMVLTAHYTTKEWALEKKVLAFFHCPPPHTGANLAEKLLSLLKEWGIEKKIFAITLDNASYNDTMVNILKRHPSFGLGLLANGEHFHIRCGAHILNLIVHEGLKVIDSSLVKIRDSVKYIRGSDARKSKFISCLEQLSNLTSKQVRQDVPTRWNSTYLMLESAIGFRDAFTLLQNMDPYFVSLSEEEWVEVEKIAEFLKPFYDITTLFSGSTYPTANLYFHGVWRIHFKIKEVACFFHDEFENENQICCMARKMKGKFEKYWDSYNVILSFAVILDPRYKLQLVEYCYVKLYGSDEGVRLAKEIHDKLHVFFQEYMSSSPNEANLTCSQRSVRGSPSIPSSSDLEDFGAFQSKLCGSSRKESDLQAYLLEDKLDHKKYANLDVLEYWKSNEGKYPELSMMARDVLSIPITTVASESAFSIGGRILNKYRSSLLPENVEALLCTNDWLCGTPPELLIDLEEVNGDDELRTTYYPCPFCAEDFDLLELCCHIDLDHPIEAKSGICPVCAMWVGTNMVDHITAQHGNIFKSHFKSKYHKHDSYPTLSISRKDQQDGHWHSSPAGLSPVMSTSKTACDPFLSFLCGAAAGSERENVQPDSSNEASNEELHSDDTMLERDVPPSLSDKDQIERARRSEFVQGLLLSTILDPGF